MMLFNDSPKSLLHITQIINNIIERRSNTLSILSHFLFDRKGDMIRFTATDLEMQITTNLKTQGNENGSITIPGRKFLDILSNIPDDKVKITKDDKGSILLIEGKNSEFSLQTMGVDDFPAMKESTDFGSTVLISQLTLKQMLAETDYAMGDEDIRYYLNGLFIKIENNLLKMVATDGHRMSYTHSELSEVKIGGENSDKIAKQGLIIPRKVVTELSRLVGDVKDDKQKVLISFSNQQIRFEFSNIVLLSKLIEGQFPDYARVLPDGTGDSFDISTSVLIGSLKRVVTVMSDEKSVKGVRMNLSPNKLLISCSNKSNEKAQDKIDIEYQGKSMSIGFNVHYLVTMLDKLNYKQVRLTLKNEDDSTLFSTPENDSFKYVVMPLRI